MDPNHILSPGERRQLRANLPPTPLPVEIQTPSVFSGPYTSAMPIGNDQNRDIPLHRRLFSTGRYQDRRDLANSPQEKDYFSLQPSREKYFIMKELTEGIYDPILKAAEQEEHRREDEAFMALEGPKDGDAVHSEATIPRRLFWMVLFYAEWVLGAIVLAVLFHFTLPFLVLGIISVAFTVAVSNTLEFVQNIVASVFGGVSEQPTTDYAYHDSFAEVPAIISRESRG
jgi:hypothetical protein